MSDPFNEPVDVIAGTTTLADGHGWLADFRDSDSAAEAQRRISAYPDLVAALQACIESLNFVAQDITKSPAGKFEPWSHPANSIRMAEAALAKAGA